MHKNNISYHLNELEDGEKFAVVPLEQLVLIANTVSAVQSQMIVLGDMLEAFGVKRFTYNKGTKTLADLPEIRVGFENRKKQD